MRKVFIILLVALSVLILAEAVNFSTFFITSFDPLNGSVDVFPIFYLTYEANENISLKFTQYGNVFDLQSPKFFYAEYRDRFGDFKVNVDLGKARLKKYYTYKLNLVRVGGVKYDYTGVGGYLRYGSFEVGGAYNHPYKEYALYASVYTQNLKGGIYYEDYYQKVSADFNVNFSIFDIWAGAAFEKFDFNTTTALIGAKTSLMGFDVAAQYAWIGNTYLIERLKSDPNYVATNWLFDFDISRDFGDYSLGLYAKYNSAWFTEGTYLLIAARAKVNDFELHLKLLGDDLNPDLSGDQILMVVWDHYFNYSFGGGNVQAAAGAAPSQPQSQPQPVKSLSVYIVKTQKPKYRFSVKGVVVAPLGLLDKNSMYIKDPTGGILVYVPSGKVNFSIGDVVKIEGTFKEYYRMPEIVASKIEKVGEVKSIAAETLKDSPEYELLGNFVSVSGVVVSKAKYGFNVQYGKGKIIKVYIKKNTGLKISNIKAGDKVTVKGVLYIYKGAFEILPRVPEDIIIGG